MTTRAKAKPLKVEKTNHESFDYVSLGYVNPVQRQRKCGSCYVFTAVATLEGSQNSVKYFAEIYVNFFEN